MTESSNMLCPNCGKFQQRAEICNHCGVVIAKVSTTSNDITERKTVEKESGNLPLAKIAVIALITITIIGYFVFPGDDTSDEVATSSTIDSNTGEKSQIDRIAAINPEIANNIHRTQVISKLHSLRTMLNMYSVEGNEPPSNEEGLQVLVENGFLTQSAITDEWGNLFAYRLEWGKETPWGKEYKIYVHSKGPDGISGNSDDIGI